MNFKHLLVSFSAGLMLTAAVANAQEMVQMLQLQQGDNDWLMPLEESQTMIDVPTDMDYALFLTSDGNHRFTLYDTASSRVIALAVGPVESALFCVQAGDPRQIGIMNEGDAMLNYDVMVANFAPYCVNNADSGSGEGVTGFRSLITGVVYGQTDGGEGTDGSGPGVNPPVVNPPGGGCTALTNGSVNVRVNPGVGANILAAVDIASPLNVLGTTGASGWLKVNVGGQDGFVNASLVTMIDESCSLIPQIDVDLVTDIGLEVDANVDLGTGLNVDANVDLGNGLNVDANVGVGDGLNVDANVGVGNGGVDVDVDANVGNGVDVGVDANVGNGVDVDVDANVGGSGGLDVDANVDLDGDGLDIDLNLGLGG